MTNLATRGADAIGLACLLAALVPFVGGGKDAGESVGDAKSPSVSVVASGPASPPKEDAAPPDPAVGNIVRDVEDLRERVGKIEERIEGLLAESVKREVEVRELQQAAKPVGVSSLVDKKLLEASELGKPLLVFVWNPATPKANDRYREQTAAVPGIRQKFHFAECQLGEAWDAAITVNQKWSLPGDRTSYVIIDPKTGQFFRVTSWEDLK